MPHKDPAARAAYQRAYRQRPEVRAKERAREPERRRRTHLKRRYGITAEQYDTMLEAQDEVCAICGRACPTGRRLAIDHDHKTGRVRGLLCANCNHALGKLADSPERLRAALWYLEHEPSTRVDL